VYSVIVLLLVVTAKIHLRASTNSKYKTKVADQQGSQVWLLCCAQYLQMLSGVYFLQNKYLHWRQKNSKIIEI